MAGKVHIHTSIGHMVIVWWATAVALVAANLEIIQRTSSNRESSNITLLCLDSTTQIYVQNAEFWRNSTHRVSNVTYGNHTSVNTSATIFLTPQEEGNYSCRDSGRGISSSNHIVLLAYPHERPDSKYSYTSQVGQSTRISCPFPRGALGHFYSHKWFRGFSFLSKNNPLYLFNEETFDLTIVATSFEDDTSGLDRGYVCQVRITPPANNGNRWVKDSQSINLLVVNTTVGTTISRATSLPPTSLPPTSLPPSPTVMNEASNRTENTPAKPIAAIVIPVISALLFLGIITISIIVVLVIIILRRSHTKRRGSLGVASTVGNYDGDRSHASTCQLSDVEQHRGVSDYALRCLSDMSNGHLPSPDDPTRRRSFEGGETQAASEQRTHNTAASHCSSLFKKPLEPRGDYPASGDVEFVGSIQEIDCDRQGGEYHNKEHSIRVRIQNDPFHAEDSGRELIELEIGVAIHGHMRFPDNWRPVSPILWFNVTENFRYEFGKPIEVELPHFLRFGTSNDISGLVSSGQLGWMFVCSDPAETRLTPMEFVIGDAASFCFLQCTGKIVTKQGCYMCLCAQKRVIETHATYCLVTAIQRPMGQSREQQTIFFFVCYHLNTFLEIIKMELKPWGGFTDKVQFVFSQDTVKSPAEEPKISILFGSKSASKGWQLSLASDTAEVPAAAVELWENDVSDLRRRLLHRRYPPRVKVEATSTGRAQTSQETFTFQGTRFLDRKKTSMQVPLAILSS